MLLVDHESAVQARLVEATKGHRLIVRQAASVAEARKLLAEEPTDLAVIEPDLPDGSGLDLAQAIRRARPAAQTIMLSATPTVESAVEALRAGAADFVTKPVDVKDLSRRLRLAVRAHETIIDKDRRIARLRRLCKKLSDAREEVSQQVDILCNDLVSAYQELATQMQEVVQTNEFATLLKEELDLEQVLRKTLEYLLRKAGPTNAAIFLPASADEFTLGGYVNYDCTSESADVLLDHLADVMAPKLLDRTDPLQITDNDTLHRWIGEDAAYLEDSHVLAFNCMHKQESLAIVVLFRDRSEPFSTAVVESCTSISPLLADYLAKVIRVHHRHLTDPLEEDDGEDWSGGLAA